MPFNAGAVYVDVVPDTTGFAAKMQSQMAGVSSKMRKIGTTLTKSVTLPIVAGLGLSLKAASDLNEAMSATNITFGKSAKGILEWSKTAATSMGLARVEALEGARGIGAMLQTAGLATGASANMSKAMVQLAGDMASFNDQDPSEMLERLRSGLAGEAEPLRKFGVFLSEAAIQAFAVKNGITAQNASMTEAEKVQARYGLILEQTTKQQGDFERTAGSVANQTRTVKAQFTDTAGVLGTALLPIAKQAADVLRGLLERFNGLSGGTKRWILIIGGIAAVAGPVIGAIGAIGGALMFLAANPIVLVIAAVVGLAALIIFNWDKIADFTKKAWDFIKFSLIETWRTIKRVVADVVGGLIAFLIRIWANFVEFFFDIAGGILDIAAKAFGWVPKVGDRIKAFRDDFDTTTKKIVEDLRDQAREFDKWGENSREQLKSTTDAVRKFQDTLKDTGSYLAAGLTVKLSVQKPRGDGIGLGRHPAGTPGALMNWAIGRYNHGLVPTSGYRPGAITSSGNPSLHSIAPPNNAWDFAGPAGSMLFAARGLAERYGAGLRELIHTPLGFSIKNGQRVAPIAVSDHYDHVHVADEGLRVRGPALVRIGNIKEDVAFIPRTGPGARELGPTINVYGDIYGYEDFRSKVVRAFDDEVRRYGG